MCLRAGYPDPDVEPSVKNAMVLVEFIMASPG